MRRRGERVGLSRAMSNRSARAPMRLRRDSRPGRAAPHRRPQGSADHEPSSLGGTADERMDDARPAQHLVGRRHGPRRLVGQPLKLLGVLCERNATCRHSVSSCLVAGGEERPGEAQLVGEGDRFSVALECRDGRQQIIAGPLSLVPQLRGEIVREFRQLAEPPAPRRRCPVQRR